MRERLDMLRIILETRRGSMKNDIAIETSRNIVLGETYEKSWEVSISCDNLICNIAGKAPNPAVVIQIKDKAMQRWINYGKTEMIEVCTYILKLFKLTVSYLIYEKKKLFPGMFEC